MAKRGARLVWINRYRNAKSTLRPLSCKQPIADEASAAILSSIFGHPAGWLRQQSRRLSALTPPYFSAPRIWPVVSR